MSDVALGLLAGEAQRRGVADRITLVHTDLATWRPDPDGYALVLGTGFWDRAVFTQAVGAVRAGGLLGWEAFTVDALRARPGMSAQWCLGPGEPASLLPPGWQVVAEQELADSERGARRRLLARLCAPGG